MWLVIGIVVVILVCGILAEYHWNGSYEKGRDSKKGSTATRRMTVGDVREDTVWLEVCDRDAEDFRLQYAIPKHHYSYSQDELDLVESLDESDRGVYEFTLRCGNDKGTLWLLQDMERVGELPAGYKKNSLSL